MREAPEVAEPASHDSDHESWFAFVSYKREDLPRVQTHLRTLARIECPVWYDTGIPGGAEWDAMIEARIRSCSFLLVFLSPAAVASKLVRREVKFADRLDKPIVPVLLEPVELARGLDMLLSQYQIIDSRTPDSEARLEATVRSMRSSALGVSKGPPPRPASQASGPLLSTEPLSDSETRVLGYMRGKPDVAWSLGTLSNLLAERPDVAPPGSDLQRSVLSLADKGFLQIDRAGGLTLTLRAVAYFRRAAGEAEPRPGSLSRSPGKTPSQRRPYDPHGVLDTHLVDRLSREAQDLLLHGESADALITTDWDETRLPRQLGRLRAGSWEASVAASEPEAARWEAALTSLQEHGLLQHVASRPGYRAYKLTPAGWVLAEYVRR